MNEKEQKIGKTYASAVAELPEEKKQFFVGYAEGMAAMADQVKKDQAQNEGS